MQISYVVRDRAGRIVVIFAGADAAAAADEWAERGYEVVPTTLDDPHQVAAS